MSELHSAHGNFKLGYDFNRMLAIKINIVLEIISNSSSSADRGEGTNDLKILS